MHAAVASTVWGMYGARKIEMCIYVQIAQQLEVD